MGWMGTRRFGERGRIGTRCVLLLDGMDGNTGGESVAGVAAAGRGRDGWVGWKHGCAAGGESGAG